MPRPLNPRGGAAPLLLALAGGLAGGLAGTLAWAGPAAAQPAPVRTGVLQLNERRAPVILDTPQNAGGAEIIDESALRYYAAEGRTARVQAEIARLKRLHPGWTEPTDLGTARPSPPEEAPLWDLFAAGRFDDLAAAIRARRTADPAWQPSPDLDLKLRRAEFRDAVRRAGAAGRLGDVLVRFRENPDAVDPTDLETRWTIAEAMAAAGDGPSALDAYRGILDTVTDRSLRLATLRKALGRLPVKDAERLLAQGRPGPDGAPEFVELGVDLTRARLAALLHDEPATEPSLDELAAYRETVRRGGRLDELSLVAWHAYRKRQFREALDWFKRAIAAGGDAMVAHGLAHTLRELGLERDAEEVAYAWRDRFVGNLILYIDLLERRLTRPDPPLVEPARLERYARVSLETGSGEGAQALAWYAYNSCQFETALEWFQRAAAWKPKEETVYGLALIFQRLRRGRELAETVNRYDGLFPTVIGLLAKGPEGVDPCAGQGAAPRGARTEAARAPVPDPRRVPVPSRLQGGGAGEWEGVQRGLFPVPIAGANPLRYPAAHTIEPERLLRESPALPQPIQARRVPGAGRMPYERFGRTLAPGWNGAREPTGLPAAARGTIHAEEEARAVREAPRARGSERDRFGLIEVTPRETGR